MCEIQCVKPLMKDNNPVKLLMKDYRNPVKPLMKDYNNAAKPLMKDYSNPWKSTYLLRPPVMKLISSRVGYLYKSTSDKMPVFSFNIFMILKMIFWEGFCSINSPCSNNVRC